MTTKSLRNIVITVLIVAIVAILIKTQLYSNSNEIPAYSKDYIEVRNAGDDFKDVQQLAQKANKKIFMIGGGNWCPWCNALDKFFKKNTDAKQYLFDNFVVIKVFTDSSLRKNQDFFSQFAKLPSTPHFYLFTKDGKFIENFETTPLETGGGPGNGYKKNDIMQLLQRWQKI